MASLGFPLCSILFGTELATQLGSADSQKPFVDPNSTVDFRNERRNIPKK